MKRIRWIIIGLLIFIAAGFIQEIVAPWSRINCRYLDIDIRTGRERTQRYIFFIKVTDRIKETSISRKWKQHFGEYPSPDWRVVCTFPGFGPRHSPHHMYHGAIAARHTLGRAFEIASFSDGAEKKALSTFLELLQSEKGDFSARKYASFLAMEVAAQKKEDVEEGDVPSFDEWVEFMKTENQ